jgi:hypothetical protein
MGIGKYFQSLRYLVWNGMGINGYKFLGQILGLAFAVVLVRWLWASDDSWWKIVEQMMKGIMGLD